MICRYCQAEVKIDFLDLDSAPPSNSYLDSASLDVPEVWYPLKIMVCERCWLVQTKDYAEREVFFSDEYAYFSSVSSTLVAHAERFVEKVIKRFNIHSGSIFAEVAANDGYLLQFVRKHGIPCYGVEPTKSTGHVARSKGINIVEEFFGLQLAVELAKEGQKADFLVANNVLAHVPDINDFVSGFYELLQPQGVATFEFHHLLKMIEKSQFDIAYHEHYSYLSLKTVIEIFSNNGLRIFDVEEIPPHGGSLRVYAQREKEGRYPDTSNLSDVLEKESVAGLRKPETYKKFQDVAEVIKNNFLAFLIDAKMRGKKIVGYGAAAKGNTLLNYSGIRKDLLPFVCDAAPSKQGKYLPGSRIPIVHPSSLVEEKPDMVLILPWNIADEVTKELDYIRTWAGQFVIAIPEIKIM